MKAQFSQPKRKEQKTKKGKKEAQTLTLRYTKAIWCPCSTLSPNHK